MKYTRFRVWILFTVLVAIVVYLFKLASDASGPYRSSNPITEAAITEGYPELYEALYRRNAKQITPFLSHKDDTVRAQAWRGLASTAVDTIDQYIGLAQQQNSAAAWFAISRHKLSATQLRKLEQQWADHPEMRKGITRVMGRQGDRKSLNFLLDNLNAGVAGTYHFALAVARLITRYEINEAAQIKIIQTAFDVADEEARRAYLYGWYRGAETPLTSAAQDTLMSRWQVQGMGLNTGVDQYVNKLLPLRTTYVITNFYNGEQDLEDEIPLSVELAKSLDTLKMTERNSLAAKILLIHPNPNVKKTVLQNIEQKIRKGGNLYRYISRSMVTDTIRSESVWLQALKSAGKVDSSVIGTYKDRIDRVVQANTYLLPQALEIYRTYLPADSYLKYIGTLIEEGDLTAAYALESLQRFWDDTQQTAARKRQVRQLIFNALEKRDRGVAYRAQPLLMKENLFDSDDFTRINRTLGQFSLPEDIEVYQQFGKLYKERFEQQARPVIDSLASFNYAPLNRSLAAAGWEVEVPEQHPDFRMPSWDRLWELGMHPRWTLRTEKGNITIEMDPLRAPATVSAIDSLSRAGAYENVPFHRVVPNFVIQGGDIERGDGFGGPDFVLPTEASELGFVRGAAGIASAGTDTEGTQYFMMLQQAPHLNGSYTRFGRVIDGMDVVDRIEMGDKVLSTSWY